MLVALVEWKSLVVSTVTANAWNDREHCLPWIHQSAYLYDMHLEVIDEEIQKVKRVGNISSTN